MADDINNPSVETESLNIVINLKGTAEQKIEKLKKLLNTTEAEAQRLLPIISKVDTKIKDFSAKREEALIQGNKRRAYGYTGAINKKNLELTRILQQAPKFIAPREVVEAIDNSDNATSTNPLTIKIPKAKGEKVEEYLGSTISNKTNLKTGFIETTTKELKDGILYERQYIENAEKEIFLIKETTRNLKEELEIRKAINAERRGDSGGGINGSEKQRAKSFKDIKKYLKDTLTTSNKFVKSFGRIALYRTIRTILSSIVNTFKDGFQFLKAYDNEAKNTLTTLSYASTALKISIATLTEPIAQLLSGELKNLSNELINIANTIAYQNAQAEGQEQVWLINKEAVQQYAEELQQANAQLTQLDKFATLSKGNPILGELVDVKDTKKLSEFVDTSKKDLDEFTKIVSETLQTINNLVTAIIEFATENPQQFADILQMIAMTAIFLSGTLGKLTSVIIAFMAIFSPEASRGIKTFSAVLLGLTAAMIAYKVAKDFLNKGWVAGLASAAIAGGLTAGIAGMVGHISSQDYNTVQDIENRKKSINAYATGGYPDSGELYIARENGQSELIGTIGGKHAVANNDSIVESVSTGVYGAVSQAFREFGGFNNNTTSGGGDVYLDGTKVGKIMAQGVYTEGVKSGYWKK